MRFVLGAGRLEPEAAQDQRGRLLEQPDQRPKGEEEPVHGARDGERRSLRVPERDPLRDELADHHVQVGDDQERDDHRQHRGHHGVELVREHLLAQGADREAGDGHAKLHRRDEARRVGGDPPNRTGALVALVLELHDPRPA